MKNYRVEKDFIVDGLRCVAIGLTMGHRCGYIVIPKEHKLYGLDYDEINDMDIEVHGGWTYSEYVGYNKYPVEIDDKMWVIGFDCAHCEDGKDIELIKSFDNSKSIQEMLKFESMFPTYGEIRTTEYVVEQLIDAVKQINSID